MQREVHKVHSESIDFPAGVGVSSRRELLHFDSSHVSCGYVSKPESGELTLRPCDFRLTVPVCQFRPSGAGTLSGASAKELSAGRKPLGTGMSRLLSLRHWTRKEGGACGFFCPGGRHRIQ